MGEEKYVPSKRAEAMCKALEDYGKEMELIGKTEGIIKLGKSLNLTDEQIISQLIQLCNISEEAAKKLLEPTVA